MQPDHLRAPSVTGAMGHEIRSEQSFEERTHNCISRGCATGLTLFLRLYSLWISTPPRRIASISVARSDHRQTPAAAQMENRGESWVNRSAGTMQLRSEAVPGRSKVGRSNGDPLHYQIGRIIRCSIPEAIRSPNNLFTTGGWTFRRPGTVAPGIGRLNNPSRRSCAGGFDGAFACSGIHPVLPSGSGGNSHRISPDPVPQKKSAPIVRLSFFRE